MPQKRRKVLFLDDDQSFLGVVTSLMSTYAGDNWEILTASDTAQALRLIQEHALDLIVVDVHMPVVDGLQFLSLLQRKHPTVLKVVLTGDASENHRAMCLSNGAELFLQKPSTAQGWQSIYTTLNALVGFQPEEGFRGVLRRVSLQDILQMECLARHSLLLQVSTQSIQGTITIRVGEIIHAEAGGRSGETAFNYLMSLRGGEFSLLPFLEPLRRSINGSWEFLLMEAARKRDEARGSAEGVPAERSNTEPPSEVSTPARSDAPVPAAGGPLQPRIDEVLICSAQGDVLYEWQCHDVNARLSFLEFLSRRAGQVGQGLSLGDFERFEAQDGGARVLAQLQTDRALLVRSSKESSEFQAV